MTATEELRKLLDGRGVEYYRHEDGEPLRELKEGTDRATSWRLGKASCKVVECEDGTLDVWIDHATPAQAIEATLGRGECRTVGMDCFGNPPYNQSGLNGNSTACGCSECGAPWSTCGLFRGNALRHNFKACPICGAKVVDE